MAKPWENHEGYRDPTAYHTITQEEQLENECSALIRNPQVHHSPVRVFSGGTDCAGEGRENIPMTQPSELRSLLLEARKAELEIANAIASRASVHEELSVLRGIDYSGVVVKSSPGRGMLETIAEALDQRERVILALECRYFDTRQKAWALIDLLQDPRQHTTMELYYIRGKTWRQVAEAMGCEERSVYRLHGRALQKLRSALSLYVSIDAWYDATVQG